MQKTHRKIRIAKLRHTFHIIKLSLGIKFVDHPLDRFIFHTVRRLFFKVEKMFYGCMG